jgi:hypothetical protein
MRTLTLLCLTCAAVTAPLPAATITLDPPSGDISLLPGQPFGWGFTITNDNLLDTISFTGSVLVNETNPGFGGYTDFIGPQGGPSLEATLGPSEVWTEAFSDTNQTGIGEFLLAPGTPGGAQDSGSIRVEWDEWDGDPVTCNCSAAQFSEDVSFQVSASSVPEPASLGMAALGGALLLFGRRKK